MELFSVEKLSGLAGVNINRAIVPLIPLQQYQVILPMPRIPLKL